MDKPNVALDELSYGKVFQISPVGKSRACVEYGGEFLVSVAYFEWGVLGYIACVVDRPGLVRYRGIAYLRVEWDNIECVGSVEWFRTEESQVDRSESPS